MPASKASTLATSTTASLNEPRVLAPSLDAAEPCEGFSDFIGSSAISPTAIALATRSDQILVGMPTMLRARLSVASDFGAGHGVFLQWIMLVSHDIVHACGPCNMLGAGMCWLQLETRGHGRFISATHFDPNTLQSYPFLGTFLSPMGAT